jgi:hypothetical protein
MLNESQNDIKANNDKDKKDIVYGKTHDGRG